MIIHKKLFLRVGKIGKALNRDGRFLGSEGYCIGGEKKRRVVGPFSTSSEKRLWIMKYYSYSEWYGIT